MHTVERLEQALAAAQKLGYQIRQEWLEGGGGACEFGGKKWIFVDLALNTTEQFEQVIEALRDDPATATITLPPQLTKRLITRKAA